ncbi:MAG: caspase family protein [Clostridia bacterium]|nr:caspase family protein [Clostridia bacterium]
MKRMLILTALMLLLPLCALAVVTVPSSVTEVGDEAFADTAIDALIVPSAVTRVGAGVLRGTDAAYIYLNGANTILADEGGAAFVFGPEASQANWMDNFYDAARLVNHGGLYYYVTDTAQPLCPKDPGGLSGSVTIPKLLNGVPVTTAAKLYLTGSGVNEVQLPTYLGSVSGVNTVNYDTMFLTSPVADVTEAPAGSYITWTTGIDGAYGDVTYTWIFDVDGTVTTATTSEPSITYAPLTEGSCTVSVTATDAVGDRATASGGQVTLTTAKRTYRALLVGNSYPGESCALDGPMTDLGAVRTVLNSMSGTPYKITTARNVTASGIQASIATAFSGAEPNDVSLFYFSGHGTPQGALVGTNDTSLSVYGLRNALQKIPGTKIVLLDCCYSGTSIGRSTASPSSFNRAIISALSSASRSEVNLEDQGYIVLTACSQTELSNTLTTGDGHYWGAFTYGLCYGSGYDEWNQVSLGRMPADANGNGAITLGEAHRGVQERINYLSSMAPLAQSTQYYGDTSFVLWAK